MFADVTFSTESLAVIGTLFTALGGVIGMLFKNLIAAKDENLKASELRGDSYKEMANEAIANLEKAVNKQLKAAGRPHFNKIADVIPEHSSPTTQQQRDTAELQTMRARLVAATLELGLAPREEKA